MTNYHLSARDIMQIEVVTILGDATIQEAAALMRYEGVRSLLVVPKDGEPQHGIITFSDIVHKVLAERRDPRQVTVEEVAIPRVQALQPDMDIQAIAQFFMTQNCGHAPVVENDGSIVGMVSMTDLITEVITEPE